MKLDKEAFARLAKSDFEFKRETRYLNGIIKIEFGGGETWALRFENGELKTIEDGTSLSDQSAKIVVGGRSDQWEDLLADKPRPFFQCLQSAAVKHQMRISDTNETFAYLPALNRMTVLLRDVKNGRA
jgi:hypothetical protein